MSTICKYTFHDREIGITGRINKLKLIDQRVKTLESSWRYSIPFRAHKNAGTSAMDFDNAENRFLLCGSLKGDVSIVDFESFTNRNPAAETYPLNLSVVPTPKTTKHSFMVNGCQWYPVDTSVFITSGMDKLLKLWDSERLIPVDEHKFAQPITQFHWLVSTSNISSLISLANASSNVSFLDPRTGNTAQQIRCQNQRIWSVRWNRSRDYTLLTGSDQGLITLWDIRSGKSELKKVQSPGGIAKTNNNTNGLTNENRKRPLNSSNSTTKTLAHTNRISCLRCTDDGRFLISSTQDQNICLWDASTLRRLSWLKITEANADLTTMPLKFEHCDEGNSLWLFVPCGNNMALLHLPIHTNGRQLDVFQNGSDCTMLRGHFQNIISSAYRKTRQQLISSSVDRLTLIWSPKMDELHFDMTARNIQQLHEDAFSSDED